MRSRLGAAIFCALLGVPASASAPPLSLTLTPHFAFEGANARVVVRVVKSPANRRLTLVWDGPLSGEDDRPHEGDTAPSQVVFDHQLINLPAGDYAIQVILLRGDGSLIRTPVETLHIKGLDAPDEDP